MSVESFRSEAQELLRRMLYEAPRSDPEQLAAVYAELLTRLHAAESHELFRQVLDDAKVRLDARLSPDPVSQGIANVQTTLQDLWRSFWD
jgi:hypothetical protein